MAAVIVNSRRSGRPFNTASHLLLRSNMTSLTIIILATFGQHIFVGNMVTTAAELMDVDQLSGSTTADSGLAHHGDTQEQAAAAGKTGWGQKDVDERVQFDTEENVYPQLLTGDDENDRLPFGMSAALHHPLRQPESRRASTGLRLIGLGKRPSGAAGGGSPLKYIGLGRKRSSAIKYIGLGRRSGNAGSEQGFPESLESEQYETTFNGDRFQGHRQRRDVAMRLIGLGRRSEYRGLNSMSSIYDDDDDDFVADGDVLRNAANAAVARQQWHQVKRRAGSSSSSSDGTGLRRMQLRRWSSSLSSPGSHVDPALLMMGIGK